MPKCGYLSLFDDPQLCPIHATVVTNWLLNTQYFSHSDCVHAHMAVCPQLVSIKYEHYQI